MTEHAIMALRTILIKAFHAVGRSVDDLDDWEFAFGMMTHEDQADWVIQLFEQLSHSDIDEIENVVRQVGQWTSV